MGRFGSSLGHSVGDQEEVELSIDDLGLFNEAGIDVGTLRRVDDLLSSDFEESLSDSLVNEDKGDLGSLGDSGGNVVLL